VKDVRSSRGDVDDDLVLVHGGDGGVEGHSSEEGGDFGRGEGGSESSAGVDVGWSSGSSSRRNVGSKTSGSIGEDDVDGLDAGRREDAKEEKMSSSDRPTGEEVEKKKDGTNVKGISVYSANMVVMMQATISLKKAKGQSRSASSFSSLVPFRARRFLNSQLGLIRGSHVDEDVLGLKSNFGVCGLASKKKIVQLSRKKKGEDATELTVGIDDGRHAENSIFRIVDNGVDRRVSDERKELGEVSVALKEEAAEAEETREKKRSARAETKARKGKQTDLVDSHELFSIVDSLLIQRSKLDILGSFGFVSMARRRRKDVESQSVLLLPLSSSLPKHPSSTSSPPDTKFRTCRTHLKGPLMVSRS